ncbi:hypothetical protein HBA54_00035 [Pelagibius litoralis]|uniref:Tail fiber protein n=1 Tax=Pelagibius litoralis TaxID=374515 RepID=A0A967C2N1_9PROT|nr:hypothetical protein [Pelagibius litoralis]NIA66975.1 hypothetical protein [Pelagibius litoralis]
MTIATTTAKSRYAGDGTTTSFPTGFKFLDNDHLRVILLQSDGGESLWTEGSEYSLSGAGAPGGGTVTVATSPSDYTPQVGETLVIKLGIRAEQQTALPLGGAFPSTAVEGMADLAALRDQQIEEALSRAVKFKETTALADVEFPEPEAGKPIAWNSTGDGLENRARIGKWQGDWVTATDYEALDIVRVTPGNDIYVCEVAHTSGVFATDLAANRWFLAINVQDVETAATNASASASAADAAASNGASSAAAAAASETAAATSETNAASSASAAGTSATNAVTSATSASASQTAASTSATSATSSASAASGSAAASETARAAAVVARTGAETAETGAVTARNAAEALYGNLAAVDAARVAAEAAQTAAATSETNAASSETAAAGSASSAGTSSTSASGSATAASNSAAAASTSQTAASASATSAGTSATNAASSASSAGISETNAANSATAADLFAILNTTSATPNAVGLGSKVFTTADVRSFAVGGWIIVAQATNADNYMIGQVTAWNSGTQQLTVNVTNIGGTGTISNWNIQGTGIPGIQGAAGDQAVMFAVGDEVTAITAGTGKISFRMPFAYTVSAVRASLKTASSSGVVTVDINEAGVSIFGAQKLQIDQDETTSVTAALSPTINDATLADDAEITVDIDAAGTGAVGLKVSLVGSPT